MYITKEEERTGHGERGDLVLLCDLMDYKKIESESSVESILKDAGLVYVRRGTIHVEMLIGENKTLHFMSFGCGDFIAPLQLLQMPSSQFHIYTATTCEVGVLSKREMSLFLKAHPTVGEALFEWSEDMMSVITLRMRDLLYSGKKGAFASTLMRLATNYGEKVEEGTRINLRISHEKLAELTGVTREYVTRALKQYEHTGVISIQRRRIVIRNEQFLKDEHHCLRCPARLCRL